MSNNVTLVTGASGFLGHAVMKLLATTRIAPSGLIRSPRRRRKSSTISRIAKKLKELLAREGVTHIIHAGGVSGPMVMADDPVGVMAINVVGSLNLLHAADGGRRQDFHLLFVGLGDRQFL